MTVWATAAHLRTRLGKHYRGLVRELAGGGVVGLAMLGLFGRFAVTGAVGQQRDTGAFYFPLTAWFAHELASGRFPLWCPLIFAGYPMVADGEIGMLYPPNVLALLILPVDVAFVAVRSGHYLLAAFGAYLLGRVLGFGRLGSAFGGVAFAFGGFMIGHLDHGNIIRSASWLPGILACAELAARATDRRRWLWMALGGTGLGLAGLGLHPQILLIDLVSLGTYLGVRTLAAMAGHAGWRLWRPAALRDLGWASLTLIAIAGLGLGLAAVQLVPTFELGEASSRGDGLTFAQAAAGGLVPADLLTLLLPYGFRADPAVQWMRYPYWESTIYVGAGTLVLSAVGIACGRRSTVLPLAAFGLAGLMLAMADHAPIPLYRWLWELPGFSSMRAPVRYTLMVELALALLAAAGLDRICRTTAPRRARLLALGVIGTASALAAGAVLVRSWLAGDEAWALRVIQDTYLTLPRDRAALTPQAVRSGVLGTLRLDNPWTVLGTVSGIVAIVALGIWSMRRAASARLASLVAGAAALELLIVAHGFHPIATREELMQASRPLKFLSQQEPGQWRAFLTGRSDLSVTSRPALFGVAQAYGYSSLPTARHERYWTRVNEVDDALLDLWNIRYVVEAKGAAPRGQVHGVFLDPAQPFLQGAAGSSSGVASFRFAPLPVDAVRILGSLDRAADLRVGEPVAEIVVLGPETEPLTLVVRAGDHLSEAAYDALSGAPAHRKATVGVHWAPRDPAGVVYPRDVYLVDLPLPAHTIVDRIEVRAVGRVGELRLAGVGVHDAHADAIRSVLPSHRAKYQVVYEDETSTIYENREAMPRAFLARQATAFHPDDWSLVQLTEQPIDLKTTVMVERPTTPAGRAEALVTGGPLRTDESADIVRYHPDQVTVRVRAAEARYLVLADSYSPDWKAWIDGHPIAVDRANYLFRGVAVPAGDHVVEWRYQPTSLYVGGAVSAVALASAIALAAHGLRARRPVPRGRASLPWPAPGTRHAAAAPSA